LFVSLHTRLAFGQKSFDAKEEMMLLELQAGVVAGLVCQLQGQA
jgi:hypothetical protein